MKSIISTYAVIVATVLFGGFDTVLKALLLLMAIDFVTGIIVAVKEKNLTSKIMFTGIARKMLIMCMVSLVHIIDCNIIMFDGKMRLLAIAFYIANEGLSIIENVGKAGVPYPKAIEKVLKQLNKGVEDYEL